MGGFFNLTTLIPLPENIIDSKTTRVLGSLNLLANFLGSATTKS